MLCLNTNSPLYGCLRAFDLDLYRKSAQMFHTRCFPARKPFDKPNIALGEYNTRCLVIVRQNGLDTCKNVGS